MIRLIVIVFLSIGFFNCSENKTEIVLNIYSEYSIPDEIDRIELRLQRAETELFSKEYKLESNSELPVKILITQENNSEELIGIRVRGKKGANILTETYVEKAFIKYKRLDVDVYLRKREVLDAGNDIKELSDLSEMEFEVLPDVGYDTDIYVDSEDLVDVITSDDVTELVPDTGCSLNCGENAKCVNGECKCNSGFENCDGKWDNGCEGDILNDPKYCGGCNSDCAPLNVEKALCNNGECGYSNCKLMYEDYDKEKKNGCEKFNYFPKVYGGTKDEFLEDMLITKDGSILLLATTKSCCFGTTDMLVIKLDKNGNVMWQRVIGKDKEIKGPLGMTELEDGNIMIIGSTNSFGVRETVGFIIRIDRNGNILNAKILDSIDWSAFGDVYCDNNSNCLIIGSLGYPGSTGPDMYEVEINKSFDIVSQRLFRINGVQGNNMNILPDAFISLSQWDSDYGIALLVLNSDKTVRYAKKIISKSGIKLPSCIQLQSDGFYCSASIDVSDNSDILLFKFGYGNNGQIIFKKAFGLGENEYGSILVSSNLLSIFLTGISMDKGLSRAFFLNFDPMGQIRYSKYFNSKLGEGVLYSLFYNNELLLLGGMSYSYGNGGMDILVTPVNIKGENISQCHFESEGDISFNFYEPELKIEDMNLEGIFNPNFALKEVEFSTTNNFKLGAKSICDK